MNETPDTGSRNDFENAVAYIAAYGPVMKWHEKHSGGEAKVSDDAVFNDVNSDV